MKETDNIFLKFSGGVQADLLNKSYDLLMSGVETTYIQIYEAAGYKRKNDGISQEEYYGELKKVFSALARALKKRCGDDCLKSVGGGRGGKVYQYVGEDKDPFREERKAIVQKRLEDYVEFCKMSYPLFPTSWFPSFFENTQLLLDLSRKEKAGAIQIATDNEKPILRNIELLPVMNAHITNQQVIRFSYKPFDKPASTLVFHPQFLKESDGRWLLFGKAEQRKRYPYVVALDRIESEVSIVDNVEYSQAEPGLYKNYFSDIVGAKKDRHKDKEEVKIRTKTNYIHGLLTTKSLHHSQKETIPYGKHDDGDYGEITISVIPNRELIGRLLNFGQDIEVISPISLRNEIAEIVKGMAEIYGTSDMGTIN